MKNNLMLIAITLALIVALTACSKIETNAVEEEIIEQALVQLELPTDTKCNIYLLDEEECAWQDGICEEYLLVIGDVGYFVGVRRNGNEMNLVDVEEQVEV